MNKILESGSVEIRDIPAGEAPFLYSTGNYGPGYVDIKGRCGWTNVFNPAIFVLASELIEDGVHPDLIVGMMTGGALPGFRLQEHLKHFFGHDIPYIYQRGARKVGGHQELDTGDRNNPYILEGANTLIVEELVNFAGTTVNGALYERSKGRVVEHAACILHYDNPVANKRLKENDITLHFVCTLPQLLYYGLRRGYFCERLVHQYREFIEDPRVWSERHGFEFQEVV